MTEEEIGVGIFTVLTIGFLTVLILIATGVIKEDPPIACVTGKVLVGDRCLLPVPANPDNPSNCNYQWQLASDAVGGPDGTWDGNDKAMRGWLATNAPQCLT